MQKADHKLENIPTHDKMDKMTCQLISMQDGQSLSWSPFQGKWTTRRRAPVNCQSSDWSQWSSKLTWALDFCEHDFIHFVVGWIKYSIKWNMEIKKTSFHTSVLEFIALDNSVTILYKTKLVQISLCLILLLSLNIQTGLDSSYLWDFNVWFENCWRWKECVIQFCKTGRQSYHSCTPHTLRLQ